MPQLTGILKLTGLVAGTVPLAALAWAWETGQLGFIASEALIHWLGNLGLGALLLTLTLSPLSRLTGSYLPLVLRRQAGLWAFAYLVLHALAWSFLDMGGDAALIRSELAEQRHLQLGLLCLLLLAPLALTSFRRAREWMGLLHWLRLHRLIYAAAIGGVIHQAMVQKVLEWPTFLSASILAALLAYRIIGALRRRPGSAGT
ncbi:ferric reductase-like transmembrane domain-containing protein [uncultured Halovibrio sp.]|uniref:ferric reductase-like transmembrane domain-containing protein n=1 Tax=uncultured Halovibrio sp. TaxID=985049 RepID=UPI0025DE8816|nr:ferric reductase-like transmembrane domain-containing protein [uncultured Halovibrio sp.]